MQLIPSVDVLFREVLMVLYLPSHPRIRPDPHDCDRWFPGGRVSLIHHIRAFLEHSNWLRLGLQSEVSRLCKVYQRLGNWEAPLVEHIRRYRCSLLHHGLRYHLDFQDWHD